MFFRFVPSCFYFYKILKRSPDSNKIPLSLIKKRRKKETNNQKNLPKELLPPNLNLQNLYNS